ncbi:VOC family protein [Stenotrophomonas rhizophila]|jgi:catechol 2,3-dioxygenase-like lactoylglutathione lyase family enzyme|uniref:VOC family protein n=1 Tax=Stenotrophomonas rhizophila TaxID=216778 RepID=UPI000456907D|nr:VOC family protein [Stenotrophomonas rhizophila]AHY57622.1 glyoxalase [Stenotrophomonas rhizophila]MDY0956893.1 VOC family protein [Stenotrophomonas rhizophila]TKK07269.1 VOC family protein [Stenotrophomonas rhizophila]
METMELYRGRLIDHLQLVVKDLAASRRFYQAVFDSIGIPIAGEGDTYFWADELFISTASSEAAAGQLTGRHHLAFQARDRATVEAFHQAALAAGGKDNGAPGERPYHPGYYAAFAIDPDGNNIEVVYHGPADYSADAVKVSFSQ